ncbi:MAG: thermonuclease family protein [Chloroflexota bacterium]|nr:thermonuclease family protein [Chloroflexota bacterium]MBI5703601.1 thermonuclease family protein [Chloroflexota bacterium]
MAQYKVIAGTFHVKGFQPDGDSIRFQANKPEHWDFFKWSSEAEKSAKKKQLRIEAIDALETHYEGWHQPRPFALAALESLLELLNITEVVYSLSVTQIVDANDGKAGYIASATTDRYGRPVSYVFPKSAKLTDGAVLDSADLPVEKSVNFLLAREGLAYPTFYTTTDRTFAEKIRAVVARARKTKRGIWSIDRTSDFTMWDVRTIQEDILLLPKLFRRLVGFFDQYAEFDKLPAYMAKQRDNLVLWDGTKKKSFADLMEFKGRRILMKTPVEDILFAPK